MGLVSSKASRANAQAEEQTLINGNGYQNETHLDVNSKSGDMAQDSETDSDTTLSPDSRDGNTSTAAAVFIVVNAAMGAGLLNFPHAFGQAGGIGPAVSMQMAFLIFIIVSLFTLSYCAHTLCCSTYQEVIEVTCGKWFGIATEVCIIVYMFGTGIAMVIIIGDQFDKVIEAIVGIDFCHHWYFNRKFTMSIFSILFIYPLCLPRNIGFLRHTSIVGVIATLAVMVTVVVQYFTLDKHPVYIPRGENGWALTLSSIPAIFFAYQCHVSSVPVYAELKRKTMANWSVVIAVSMLLCASTYTITGIFGYLTFGDIAKSDVLQSYDAKDWFVIAARISVVIAMITSYPILHFCGRSALMTLLHRMNVMASPSGSVTHEVLVRYVMTSLWFFPSLALALLVPNIGVAIALVGGIAACFILVFPGFALARFSLDFGSSRSTWKTYALVGLGLLLFIGGIFLFGEITTRAILDDISNQSPELSSKCYK